MSAEDSPQEKPNVRNGGSSVLADVRQRTRQRRRRARVPAWIPWVVRCSQKTRELLRSIGTFLRSTLPQYLRQHRQELQTAAASLSLHLILFLLLAFWMLPPRSGEDFRTIVASVLNEADQLPLEIQDVVQPPELLDLAVDSTVKQLLSELKDGLTSRQIEDPLPKSLQIPMDVLTELNEIPVNPGMFGGRSDAGRRAAVQKFGGTADSERAVNDGLRWFAGIQQSDGSWSFGKVGDSGSPGSLTTTDMGATSLALLCFLGAGHTHRSEGPWQQVVQNGLDYLMKNAARHSTGTDLRGNAQGNSGMYVQGIAAICVCEASALVPDDKELRKLAIESITFIERSQDPVGGGWRYQPRQPGDTSVVGWQLMALQSAKAGRIRVSGPRLRNARQFLDSVQADKGARYGYMSPQMDRPAMTAVGLLCRMYLGWKPDHDALRRGVHHLATLGPSSTDLYYNYYATQVLHHFGGDLWDQWNLKMRQQLVESQVRDGPAAGSWDVTDPHGGGGGRIYQTALSILTLEVYYRHLPIYRQIESTQADSAAAAE